MYDTNVSRGDRRGGECLVEFIVLIINYKFISNIKLCSRTKRQNARITNFKSAETKRSLQ